ncbi:MAG: hypothetical protein QM535_09820 [Limnohabitans sp.]|nr:hypothetical protein [Limnohabitans sp.]
MHKKIFLLLLFAFYFSFSQEKQVAILFTATFENSNLELNKNYTQNQISIHTLKYYISNISFMKDGEIIYNIPNSFYLIDYSSPSSLKRLINLPENLVYNSIQLMIGIDEKTNDNGIGEGDLDPVKDMYWTWNTGYINFKLEGKSEKSPSKDKSFQFHLGGFLAPNIANKTVIFRVSPNSNQHTIHLNLQKLINEIDFKTTPTIMSPSKKSVELIQLITKNMEYVPQN